MKFTELKSIGHNIADSMASGIGLMIGVYEIDVFADAGRSPGGALVVDLLSGTVIEGEASPSTARAVALYAKALPDLCTRHSVPVKAFEKLEVRFGSDQLCRPHFTVTVADRHGKESKDFYFGRPGAAPKGHP